MSKLFIPVALVALSLLALTVAERRLDNSKEVIESRDGHVEEHRPKKLFGKLKRQKSQYGPPKVHHQPKKHKYGPPPVNHGPPHQAYGNPKPIHPPPQANYRTPPYPHHSPQAIVYNRPGPPQSNYRPPAHPGHPQVAYNRPDPVFHKPAPNPPVYVQPVPTYSQPAAPENYNLPQVHATKPEVSYNPPAPSYNPPQVQVTPPAHHQPAHHQPAHHQPAHHQPAQSYFAPEHDDSHEGNSKPSEDLPLTSGYNVPHPAHAELPTAVYVAPAPQHYKQAKPKPVDHLAASAYLKQELTGNHHQQPVIEDDPPKQTAYNPQRPSYSEDTSYDVSTVAPSVSWALDSYSYTNDDDKFSSPNDSDFPSLFDPSSDFYKQSDYAPDANDDSGFFQIGVFPKTGSLFEQNYKG